MKNFKLSTLCKVEDFYLATYSGAMETATGYKRKAVTTLLIKLDNGFLDFDNDCRVDFSQIDYLKPLSKYANFEDGCISIQTAKEISLKYKSKFYKENLGKPKRWEPQVSIAETIPYLKVTNSFIDDSDQENEV